ncbi:MAG: DUF805 domain-containing protein [Bacteroidota bacterium]
MNWYFKVLKQYADFKGRARRKEYWMFYLFNMIISIVLGFLDGLLGMEGIGIGFFYSLAVLIPTIAAGVRRIHDAGKSGWFLLVPIYNLILLCTDSEAGDNKWGPNPKNPNTELDEIGVAEA